MCGADDDLVAGRSTVLDPTDDAQLISNLMWAGGSRLVRDVWVAGEQVLAGGEPTRVNRTVATTALRAVAASLRS